MSYLGIFKSKKEKELERIFEKMRFTTFPNGEEQIDNESNDVYKLLEKKYSFNFVKEVYVHISLLFNIAEDKSLQRIIASTNIKTDGKITDADIEKIYNYIIEKLVLKKLHSYIDSHDGNEKVGVAKFNKDFGIYLKENGAQKGANIQIIDNFIPELLVFFPDGKASITANINNMLASFDLEYNVLNIFLSIFAQYGFLDKEGLRQKMGKLNEGIPIGFKISDDTRALEICGVVMSCELGENDSSKETGEEFIPLNVVDIQIVEDPVARVIIART